MPWRLLCSSFRGITFGAALLYRTVRRTGHSIIKSGVEVIDFSFSAADRETEFVAEKTHQFMAVSIKKAHLIGIQSPSIQYFRSKESNESRRHTSDEMLGHEPTMLLAKSDGAFLESFRIPELVTI